MIELPKAHWPRKPPQHVYIRFGRWSSRSCNWSTGAEEKGVSAYPALRVCENIVRLDAEDFDIPIAAIQGRLVFVITGQVVGRGSDGEPILRRVKVLPYAIDFMSMPEGIQRSAWA